MENIETSLSSIFYPNLKDLITARIADLRKQIKIYENIDIARGLFGHEKKSLRFAMESLTTNENYMIFFDADYLKMQ